MPMTRSQDRRSMAFVLAATLLITGAAPSVAEERSCEKTFNVKAKTGGAYSINAVAIPQQQPVAVTPVENPNTGMFAKQGGTGADGANQMKNIFDMGEDHHHGPAAMGAPPPSTKPTGKDLLDLINKIDPEAAQVIQNAVIEEAIQRQVGRAAQAINDAVARNEDAQLISRMINRFQNMVARAANVRDPDKAAIENMGNDILNGLDRGTVNNPNLIKQAMDAVPTPPPKSPQEARDRAYDDNDFSGVGAQAPAHAGGNLRTLRNELLNAQGMATDTIRNINSTPAQRNAARAFLRTIGPQLRAASGLTGDDTALRNDLNQAADTADLVADQWQNYNPTPGR